MTVATAVLHAPGRGKRTESGFTLVEVIVALALLAMVTALLAGSMRGMRFVHAAMERSERSSSVQAAQSYLRSLFAAIAPNGGVQLGAASSVFIGDATSMTFRSTHTALGEVQGIYRVTLSLQPSAGSQLAFDLVVLQTLDRTPRETGTQPDAPSRRSALVTGIAAASFGYFGSQGETGEDMQLSPAWTAADRLPRLVRIALRFPPGDPRTWGVIELPLQLAGQDAARCSGRQPC